MQRERQRRLRSDHLRNEAAYLPSSLEELEDVRRRLVAAGTRPATASGVVGWLLAKAHGEDPTDSVTRSKYRKLLTSIGVPTGPDGGFIRATAMPATAGAMGTLALATQGHTAGAVAAALVGLYVTRNETDELELGAAA